MHAVVHFAPKRSPVSRMASAYVLASRPRGARIAAAHAVRAQHPSRGRSRSPVGSLLTVRDIREQALETSQFRGLRATDDATTANLDSQFFGPRAERQRATNAVPSTMHAALDAARDDFLFLSKHSRAADEKRSRDAYFTHGGIVKYERETGYRLARLEDVPDTEVFAYLYEPTVVHALGL